MNIAITNGSLSGCDTLNDVRKGVLPTGQDKLILRFKDHHTIELPILRKCTTNWRGDRRPNSKSVFIGIFQTALINDGYSWVLFIHANTR